MLDYILQSTPLSVTMGIIGIFLLWTLYVNRNRNTPPGPIVFPVIGSLHVLVYNHGNVLKTFQQLRSIYGDLFSLKFGSYDVVVVNGYENLKELLSKKGDEVSARPDIFLFKDVLRGEGLAGSDGVLWKTHRTFAISILRNFGFGKRDMEHRIMEEVDIFIEAIESKKGKPFDLDGLIQASICNVILSVICGQRFEYENERFTALVTSFKEMSRLSGPSALVSIFPFLKQIPGDLCKAQLVLDYGDKIRQFIDEMIQEHKDTYVEDDARDYIDAYLKEQKQNTETFTDAQLNSSIFDIIIGGTETTSSTIKWAILYFIHNKDIQNKMRQELDDVIGTSRPPSLNDRDNLPYCDAVVTEVLRCGNVTPFSLQHSCYQDVSFKEFTIKQRTIIIPNIDSVLSDSNEFGNSEMFSPERFIDEQGKVGGKEKVISFAIGRRVCLGELVAKAELFLYLTSMIQRFTFEAKDENNLPPLEGILGATYTPKPYEFCAIRRH